MPVIDAHQHYWTLGAPWHEWPTSALPAIHHDFLPEDLAPELEQSGVLGSILVQSQPSHADTDWMLSVAERTPTVLGVVGWIDPTAAGTSRRIAALAAYPKLRGLRPMLQNLPSDWILQSAAQPALTEMTERGLVLDALVRPAHLPAITAIARQYPELRIVVDHAAKPDIAGKVHRPWADDLARLAEQRNVACKLSGLITEAGPDWTADQLAPWVERVLAIFGPERVMWGSDWPVLLTNASYADWLSTSRALVPPVHHAAVFGGTAARLYGIAPAGD